jgi:PhnB protein
MKYLTSDAMWPRTPSRRHGASRRSGDGPVARSGSGNLVGMPTGADAGYHTLTPRIVTTDLLALVELLRSVFGATGDVEPGRPAELRIGDSLVMVSEAGERDVFPAFLYVYVDDVEATWERAVAAGAETVEEPLDTPYGDRRAMVQDPFGNVYQIARPLSR